MDKILKVYWNVEDSVHRTVNLTAVLEMNDSQIFYEHVEYRPAGTRDSDIAQAALKWAMLESDEFYAPIEYGSNLGTTISSVYGYENVKLTKVEDHHNSAWKQNVLTEAHEDRIARAGLIG